MPYKLSRKNKTRAILIAHPTALKLIANSIVMESKKSARRNPMRVSQRRGRRSIIPKIQAVEPQVVKAPVYKPGGNLLKEQVLSKRQSRV